MEQTKGYHGEKTVVDACEQYSQVDSDRVVSVCADVLLLKIKNLQCLPLLWPIELQTMLVHKTKFLHRCFCHDLSNVCVQVESAVLTTA